MTDMLEVEDLTKVFAIAKNADLIAVNNVSFSLKRGETLGLVGESGCGKTTVARLLAGETSLAFEQISAVFSGVADLKKVFESAKLRRANATAMYNVWSHGYGLQALARLRARSCVAMASASSCAAFASERSCSAQPRPAPSDSNTASRPAHATRWRRTNLRAW